MKKLKLTVRREGSLLSRVLSTEITEQQLEAIKIVIDDEKMAYNVVEDKRVTAAMAEQYPEYARLFGIEQYQAESR